MICHIMVIPIIHLLFSNIPQQYHISLSPSSQVSPPRHVEAARRLEHSGHQLARSILRPPVIITHSRCRLLGRMVWAMYVPSIATGSTTTDAIQARPLRPYMRRSRTSSPVQIKSHSPKSIAMSRHKSHKTTMSQHCPHSSSSRPAARSSAYEVLTRKPWMPQ